MRRLFWIVILAVPLTACGASGEPSATDHVSTPSPTGTETPRVVGTLSSPIPHRTPTAGEIAHAQQIISDSAQAGGTLHDLVSAASREFDEPFPVLDENDELLEVGIILHFDNPIDVPALQAHGLTRAVVYVDLGTDAVTRITPWPR